MKADRNETGVIFNIQKYSVNDGPGIRTVVFFKGCPLRCRWCSNPESQLARIQILQDPEKCLHCHHCIEICPRQAVCADGTAIQIDPLKCNACGNCIPECPGRALSLEGEVKTVQMDQRAASSSHDILGAQDHSTPRASNGHYDPIKPPTKGKEANHNESTLRLRFSIY